MKYNDLNAQAKTIAREEVRNSFGPWDIDPDINGGKLTDEDVLAAIDDYRFTNCGRLIDDDETIISEPEEHGTISYDVNNGETLSITQNGYDRLVIVEYGSGLVREISSGEMVMMMNLFNVMQENGFDESLDKCFDALEK